jgi:hypothetical protein
LNHLLFLFLITCLLFPPWYKPIQTGRLLLERHWILLILVAMFLPFEVLATDVPMTKMNTLRQKAENGDTHAQFDLAVKLRDGKGVSKSDSEALRWAHQSALRSGPQSWRWAHRAACLTSPP